MKSIDQHNYVFLYSDKSIDLFNYFNVDHLHGLKRSDCIKHVDSFDDCFIAGLCNLIPYTTDKYFVYVNTLKTKNKFQFITLMMHEMMHLSFRLNDQQCEEQLIEFAENETNKLIKIFFK